MHKLAKIISGVLILMVISTPASAREVILGEEQIASIRESCVRSQVDLKRVHTADALTRVNLGQRYESMSLRLMAPLNSRMSMNGLNIVEFASTTAKYSVALKSFAKNYIDYESTISSALKLKCQDSPVEYYSLIESAREKRTVLHGNTQELNQLANEYLGHTNNLIDIKGLK